MESEVGSFTVESVIRGYHIYKEVWSSVIGEVLICRRDMKSLRPFNLPLLHACKATTVVGNVAT